MFRLRKQILLGCLFLCAVVFLGFLIILTDVQTQQKTPAKAKGAGQDGVMEAQTPRDVPAARVEQRKTDHDQSNIFASDNAQPSSTAFQDQPDQGHTRQENRECNRQRLRSDRSA